MASSILSQVRRTDTGGRGPVDRPRKCRLSLLRIKPSAEENLTGRHRLLEENLSPQGGIPFRDAARSHTVEQHITCFAALAIDERCPMKRTALLLFTLVLTAIACGSVTLTPALVTETLPPLTSAPATIDLSALWYLTRGDAKSDQAWGVDTDSQGNVYVAAYMQQPPSRLFFDMVIYKFSPDGKEIWQTQWGGDLQEKAFIVTVSEPYVFVGGLAHTAMALTEADMAVLALDMNSGQVMWKFTWGQGFGYEEVDGLVVDGDYIYVSGWTTGEKTSGDMAVLKLDRDGNLIWVKTWGTDGFDEADGQIVVDEDTIYVSGRVNAPNMLSGGDAVIVKFSKESGDYLAHSTWGGTAIDDGLGMTSDGTYLYVVGLTLSFGNGGQIFLLKYDKDLNLMWQQIWGGPKGESARAVEVDNDGNILVAGATASYGNGEDDVVLLQYTPDGVLNWKTTWGGPMKDAVHGLAIDGDFAYLAGTTESYSKGQNDALVIKADSQNGQFPLISEQSR